MTSLKALGLLLGFCALFQVAAQDMYRAADGFYTVTAPPGWQTADIDAGLALSKDAVDITLRTMQADSAEAAIAAAFARIDIEPGNLISEADAPLPNGNWKQEIYAAGSQLRIGLAQLREGRALALLIVGEQADMQAINPQILQLLTSIHFAESQGPAYVDRTSFAESEVRFGSEPFVLDGTFSLPHGPGPFPALVIVHGSGPQNRDGLLGPLTPYLDLARGLATRGIAVLRYDKRTLSFGASLQIDENFTIDSEVTEDALQALEYLRQHEQVDDRRLFVLGHSLGASLTPRVLARDPDVAGGILLAAPARSFSTLLAEQLDYIAAVNPDAMDSPTIAYLQGLAGQFAQVAAGASYEESFGEWAAYMQSLETLDAIAEAKAVAAPLLLLQGERDYQVTMADFDRWRAAFASESRASLLAYPALNHMFMAAGDPSRLSIPQDYAQPAFVDAAVIDDIADWIAARD